MRKSIILLACAALLCAFPPVRTAAQFTLPDTPAGRRVADYIKAFNSGDEKVMREFFVNNFSADALKQRPVEPRLEVYRQVHGNRGRLEPRRVLKADASAIAVLFQAKGGEWMTITFTSEPQPPHLLLGLRFEDAEPPAGEASAQPTAGAAATPQPPLTEAEAVAAAEKMVAERAAADEFSGVLLIARGDKPILQKTYGSASREYNAPNRPDTIFNLGSINKIFTNAAITQLVEGGKLSLDDKLGKHLPDYPNRDAAAKVTIRQLLSMTSGIGDFFNERFDAAPKNRFRTIKDYLPLFASEPLEFEPGSKQQYSNGGYIVLGAIVEKVSGRDYFDYVRENIFKPIGMSSSDWYEVDRMPPNAATNYTRQSAGTTQGGRVSNVYLQPAKGSPAGGGHSTAGDLLKFALALQSGKLRLQSLGQPPAAGAQVTPAAGFTGLGIAGGSPGVNAIFSAGPSGGYTVIVLSNYDPPSAESLGVNISRMFRRVKS